MQKTIETKAKIKLIQPQLNSASGWVGEYKDQDIIFKVADHIFINKVMDGGIAFKGKDTLICDIAVSPIIDEEIDAIKYFEIIVGNCAICRNNE